MLGEVGARDAPVEAADVQHGHAVADVLEAQQHRDGLGDDGREGGAGDAPAERADHDDDETGVEQA